MPALNEEHKKPPEAMSYKDPGNAAGTKIANAPDPIINPKNIASLLPVFIFDYFLFLRNSSSSFMVSNLLYSSKSIMALISVVKY